MPDAITCHMNDAEAFDEVRRELDARFPTLRFGRLTLDGEETELRSEHGGQRIFWLYEGSGEAFLPAGHRTQEGDGHRLPKEYIPEPIDPAFAGALRALRDAMPRLRSEARVPVESVLSRRNGDAYLGDYANDLWKLEHTPRPWSTSGRAEELIESLWSYCARAGYSVKARDSWEPLIEGDQLVVARGESMRVRGRFSCLTLEHAGRPERHVPAVMRLRYLRDSSGGCNFDFDPFRRLPLTWSMSHAGETGDGINFANSHVVNIAKETSPSHFHPVCATGGGLPQTEFYLVLDPAAYNLLTHGREASLIVFPDLRDFSTYRQIPLRPGQFVVIPPGTGHRGIDVFVNVITVPGFKPRNEYYLDREIMERGNAAPYNENLLDLKNYTEFETLLA